MRTRSWDEVQGILDTIDFSSLGESSRSQGEATEDRKGKGKAKDERKKKKKEHQDAVLQALEDAFGGERLRSINSMMKKALQQEGSRDVSAQLFLSLARACGLGARLVASLQPVPWRAEKAAPKPKRTRAARQGMGTEPFSGEDELEEVPISAPPGSDEKFNPFKLRKPRPAPQTPGGKTRKPKREGWLGCSSC
jgi:xeroderma pigmentosum group C-complementing protein